MRHYLLTFQFISQLTFAVIHIYHWEIFRFLEAAEGESVNIRRIVSYVLEVHFPVHISLCIVLKCISNAKSIDTSKYRLPYFIHPCR